MNLDGHGQRPGAVTARIAMFRRYLFGYHEHMASQNVLEQARQAAGLSQAALAKRSGTSRPTLSAYERGRKSPTLDTAARILAEAGFDLTITPRIEFREVAVERGRPIQVPNALPRLSCDRAFAMVALPLYLNWSDRGRRFDLRDRRQRARVYELVLREGGDVSEADLIAFCAGRLAGFKRPERIVLVERLPRTSTGKLLRRDLPDLLEPSER